MKKLPPYGENLHKYLASGRNPKNTVYCFCGMNAMNKAKFFSQYRFTLYLPPYENPNIYKWPVNKCEILLFETGNLEIRDIEELAYHLLHYGATVVRALNSNYEMLIFRRKTA